MSSPVPEPPTLSATPPSAATRPGAAVSTPGPSTSPAAPSVAKPPAGPARFAVEFGPFTTVDEAERVERQLTQAGLATARFRQQTGAGLYAVLIEKLPAGRDAQAVTATLHEQGFADASVIRQDPPAIRLGEPLPLRGAVDLAERARGVGHPVRVAAEPGEAMAYVLRHGTFPSRADAETKATELGRLGLSPQVIQVR